MEFTGPQEVFARHGRRHPLLRLVLFTAIFLSLVYVFWLPLAVALLPAEGDPNQLLTDLTHPAAVVLLWVQLVAAVVATYLATTRFDEQSWRATGLWFHPGWQRHAWSGLVLGFVLILPIFGVLLATRVAHLEASSASPLRALRLGLLVMVPGALSEELIFRGYVLRNLTQAFGARWGILGSSLIFSALHLFNVAELVDRSLMGVVVIAVASIFLAGILMGSAYLRTGSLWLPVLLHFSWNFTQSTLLGMPVSGLSLPGLIHTSLSRPYWLSGGPFGPEGSLLAILALLGGLYWLTRRGPTTRGVVESENSSPEAR